ncbi:MAG: hypothetical protein Q8Q42_02525 [Nanoarchaeota archaeon]|nr:hypothetical protein [Nanoarchaeota archaeon]
MITTIQLSKELKDKIASFGSKNETYEQILERVYAMAVRTQLREFLMSGENCITVKEALKRAEAKYGNSNH